MASVTEELFGLEHFEFRWQAVTMGALHEGSEAYLVGLFEDSLLGSNSHEAANPDGIGHVPGSSHIWR